MGKIIIFTLLTIMFFSCKKDKTTPPCTGISLTGDREVFVGKWRWYSTRMEQWFDIGPSNFYDVTPQSEGFEYYFTLSSDGIFKGYRNDTLIHDHILDSVEYEIFNENNTGTMLISLDCTSDNIDLRQFTSNVTNDTTHTLVYPLNIDDQANHLKSHRNFFVKE